MSNRVIGGTMENFEDLIKRFTSSEFKDEKYINSPWKYYKTDTKMYKGNYCYYESDDFIIDIHNLFMLEDFMEYNIDYMEKYVAFASCFVISGNGELFTPYRPIEPFSVFIMNAFDKKTGYLLHKNSRLFLVSVKFKKSFFEKHYPSYFKKGGMEIFKNMLFQSQDKVVYPLSELAHSILTCKLTGKEAEKFFENTAKTWFNITVEAVENMKKDKKLSTEDEKLIENVERYISDHYSCDISQTLLGKIACMSKTKLKETFKRKNHLSITEFIQRKRMNIAEQLLIKGGFEIKQIAEIVGYNSPSRFSKLYKRYKGVYPREVKKMLLMIKENNI